MSFRRAIPAVFIWALAASSFANAATQNVILITFDGVRHQDIYKPEYLDFLKPKLGYPLAHTLRYARHHRGAAWGTQTSGDKMEVGNASSKSLPGYRALLSGQYETRCTDNDCTLPPSATILDGLFGTLKNKQDIAVFSSWNKIQHATEVNGKNVFQSVGLTGIRNFSTDSPAGVSYLKRYLQLDRQSRADLPPWKNARRDKYTWQMGVDYIKTFHPQFAFLSLLDTDEWAHEGNREQYFRTLSQYDDWLRELLAELQKPEHAEYFKNTSIVITTDHGRGESRFMFPYHGYTDLGIYAAGSENIWAIVLPSQSLRERYRIGLSNHGSKSHYSQLDIRPTLSTLLERPHLRGSGPGRPLIVLQIK